jgi:hypothetical protein
VDDNDLSSAKFLPTGAEMSKAIRYGEPFAITWNCRLPGLLF